MDSFAKETDMANYVDAFVLPVARDNLDAYRKMAETAGEVWREHGALDYVECIADDVKPGKVTSFPQAVDLKEGEVVIFAYVTYASREKRDEVMAKVMSDPRLSGMAPKDMPFDGMRMFWGGFKVWVEV
jgi:uncharacterized protein YbaA (DUF1428 family)